MPDHLTDEQYWNQAWRKGETSLTASGIMASASHWSNRKTRNMLSNLLDSTQLDEADFFEIGCAPGSMLLLVKDIKPNYRLHGIDFAEEGIEIARRRFQALGIQAQIHFGDIREFPTQRKYDIVFSHGFIEHFENLTEIINHHKRFVKPGGYILLTLPNYAPPPVKFFIQRFDPEVLVTHNLNAMDKDKLSTIMSSVGLENVRVGWDGGPRLRSGIVNTDIASRIYLQLARSWNFLVSFLPSNIGWQSRIWGIGQLSDEK